MLTVFHTGDVHMDVARSESEQVYKMDQLIEAAKQSDLAVVAGDLVCIEKERRAREFEREQWRRFCHEVTASGTTVFILGGNHDKIADMVPHLGDIPGVVSTERPGVHRIETRQGPVQVFALPFLREIVWVPADADVEKGGRKAFVEEQARKQLAEWRTQVDTSIPSLLVYHGDVSGSQIRAGQPSQSTEEPKLALEDFIGFKLVLAAHIHYGQELPIPDGGKFVYCGSPWAQTFGEEGQASKGPLLYTFAGPTLAGEKRVEIDFPRLLTVLLQYAPHGDEPACRRWMTGEPYASPTDTANPIAHLIPGAAVRVLVHCRRSDKEAVDLARIKQDFLDAGAKTVTAKPKLAAEEASKSMGVRKARHRPVLEQLEIMWTETQSGPQGADRDGVVAALRSIEADIASGVLDIEDRGRKSA